METYFVAGDVRGSMRVVREADGSPAAWFGDDPFGAALESQHGGDAGLAARLMRRYTGQVFEQESGLYHYGARLCDTTLARFVTADPAEQTPSPYAYCANDPVDHVDPDGSVLRRVIYYKRWFVMLDEHDNVAKIVGENDRVMIRFVLREDLLAIYHQAQSLRNAFNNPAETREAWEAAIVTALRTLAEPGEAMPVSARTRLEHIIQYALASEPNRIRSDELRTGFASTKWRILEEDRGGLRHNLISKFTYRSLAHIDKTRLTKPNVGPLPGLGVQQAVTEFVGKARNAATFMTPKSPIPFYSKHQLKMLQMFEGGDPQSSPLVTAELKHHMLASLAAHVLGPSDPPSPELADAIRKVFGLHPPPPPSNTTTITARTSGSADDDLTESLSDSDTESLPEPAKRGGEKPYISSSDEDESL